MALNGKTVSVKELIGEIYASHKYTYNLPWQDAIAWAAQAIELIGAPKSLSNQIERIEISNYRGMLPCNLHSITQAAGSYNGCSPFAMRSTTNTFGAVASCDSAELTTLIELFNSESSTTTTEPIGEDISGNPVYTFQNGNMSMPETTSDNPSSNSSSNTTYNVSDNFIFTSFASGYVYLAFKALPIDDEGFPLIPDNRRFKEAVKAYIVSKIDYILWRSKELDKDVFERSEREWLWYVASAGTVARVPSYDEAQSLLNAQRLISQKYSHNSFFTNLGA